MKPASAPHFDLNGRVALVAGGSRGLGRAMALGFARAGDDVVIASRNGAACDEFAAEVTAETGRRALGVDAHVGRWESLDRLVDTVYLEFGKVDVLVNNASMSPLYGSVENVSEELFDKTNGVNLKGPFRLVAMVGSRMAGRRRRLDHQRLHRRGGLSPATHPAVRRREGRAQRLDDLVRAHLGPDGPGQRDHGRHFPHRREPLPGRGGVRQTRRGLRARSRRRG